MYNNTITDDAPYAKHSKENIQKMCSEIDANKLVSIQEENRGLVNVLVGKWLLLSKLSICYLSETYT